MMSIFFKGNTGQCIWISRFFIDFPLYCFSEENGLKRDLPLVFQAACFLNLASVLSGQFFTMGDFCYLLQYKSLHKEAIAVDARQDTSEFVSPVFLWYYCVGRRINKRVTAKRLF